MVSMAAQTPKFTASDIARWFVAWSDECEANIDPMKLQKLLYYAQGHFLAKYDRPLFRDQVKAWAHGPVVPAVWHEYKDCGKNDIDVDTIGDDFNWDTYGDVNDFLVGVYATYGKYAGWTLRNMTHREAPWKDAFNGSDDSPTISCDSMKTFFQSVA